MLSTKNIVYSKYKNLQDVLKMYWSHVASSKCTSLPENFIFSPIKHWKCSPEGRSRRRCMCEFFCITEVIVVNLVYII